MNGGGVVYWIAWFLALVSTCPLDWIFLFFVSITPQASLFCLGPSSFHSILIFPLDFFPFGPISSSRSTHLSRLAIPPQDNDVSTLNLLAARFCSEAMTLWTSSRLYYWTSLAICHDNKRSTALNSPFLGLPLKEQLDTLHTYLPLQIHVSP